MDKANVKKSLVKVCFPEAGKCFTYYNDAFELEAGDIVYVEGSMEGQRGIVSQLSYSFKIRLSDYKRIVARAATKPKGELFMMGRQFVAFDRETIAYEQLKNWFKAPDDEQETVVSCGGIEMGTALNEIERLGFSEAVMRRGMEYYQEERVLYICLDGEKGRALVGGSSFYELEFEYRDGMISYLFCDCPYTDHCKHEYAAMLQLKSCLEGIEKQYSEKFRESAYFAAVSAVEFFRIAMLGKSTGSFIMK